MTTTTRIKQEAAAKIGPKDSGSNNMRTLWRARLRVGTNKDEFLFRANEEFDCASEAAQKILLESPSCKVAGAVIVAVERVARLWN